MIYGLFYDITPSSEDRLNEFKQRYLIASNISFRKILNTAYCVIRISEKPSKRVLGPSYKRLVWLGTVKLLVNFARSQIPQITKNLIIDFDKFESGFYFAV